MKNEAVDFEIDGENYIGGIKIKEFEVGLQITQDSGIVTTSISIGEAQQRELCTFLMKKFRACRDMKDEAELSRRLKEMMPVEIKYEGNDAVLLDPRAWEEIEKGITLLFNKTHFPEYDDLLCKECYGLPNEAGECPKCL